MKDAYYFSHDSNAHKDPKILKLRAKHGWEGYGIFWAVIESLREQDDYKWKASEKQLLSFCFSDGSTLVNDVIDTCLEIGLLEIEDDFIFSKSLSKRMKKKDEIIEKRRQAGKKGGSSKREANAKQNASNKRKGKESKLNKSKEEKTIREIKDLRASYSPELIALVDTYWSVIKKTRKSNSISYNVILKTMQKWSKYDRVVIHYALKKHIESYDDGERDEKYTLGIMRNTTPEEAEDLLNKKVMPFRKERRDGIDRDRSRSYSGDDDYELSL